MPKLFRLLIGATAPSRNIEQHDIFFGVGEELKDMVAPVQSFWPEAVAKLHFDAWRQVEYVNGFHVEVVPIEQERTESGAKLFFINLGGYKSGEFEEFHYKMIVAAPDKGAAVALSKETAFFRHTGFKGANAHIDDKYGIDVDDIFEIKDILTIANKQQYKIVVTPVIDEIKEDEIHLGYFKFSALV